MTPIENMRLRLGIKDGSQDAVLSLYLEDANEFILAYTRRRYVPAELSHAWIRIAVILYNRRGMEGSQKFNIGDTSYIADVMPHDIIRHLNSFRAARIINLFRVDEEGVEREIDLD